ncbi:MAG: caspase family protein [Blastocatellia bacterium]
MAKTRIGSFFFLTLFVLGAAARAEDRALIVGIENYRPGVRPALGALHDAGRMKLFALDRLKFTASQVRVLKGPDATGAGIARAIEQWLIAGTKAGDRVFFYYSGHGSNLPDTDNEESDGWDETIVPYDVGPGGAGQIRDDQFARWVAELAGRRIVMIFDSCHSGTISRGIGVDDGDKASRYLPPDELTIKSAPQKEDLLTRDFKLVSDGLIGDNRISQQSDLVVISAAQQDQKAYSMLEGGQWVGGLTDCLLAAYQNGAPALNDLKASVEARILQLRRDKKLKGDQVPQFEFNAQRQGDEPLFGAWERLPAIALANPNSKITVGLQTNDAGNRRNTSGHLVYYEGERISYNISTNTSGYLYLLAFSHNPKDGSLYVSMLFPHQDEGMKNDITPKGLRLPENAYYDIEATGLDVTVALVTTRPLPIEIKEKYSWDEMFQSLKLKDLQQQVAVFTRGHKVTPREFDWQSAAIPIFTTKK